LRVGDAEAVHEIVVEMSELAFKKGGWTPKRPADVTSAQMSAPYAAACQIVDGTVLAEQFTPPSLERDEIWKWADKIRCVHNPDFDKDKNTMWFQRMSVAFTDKSREKVEVLVKTPRGVHPLLTNEEIMEKWTMLTRDVIDAETRERIEKIVLSLGNGAELSELIELLGKHTETFGGF
jgi:aconitate decarboxylase